jgi:addiction module RelE/StbE family toxin
MAIKIFYTNSFLKSVKKLPNPQKKKLSQLLEILRQQPFHLKLHTKQLTGSLTGFYSFRITRDWRVIFQFIEQNAIKLIEVAHRKEIYR